MANLRAGTAKILVCAFLSSFAGVAQVQPGQLAQDQTTNSFLPAQQSSSTDRHSLTVGQKYQLALKRTFDPAEILRLTLSAGIDHWRNYPSEWGQGWDAFGVRVASALGQQFVREHLDSVLASSITKIRGTSAPG